MEDGDAGGGAVYTTCRIDGEAVCGLFEMAEGAAAWTSYVTVADAGAAAARAAELGGAALGDAFDVLDAGRTAILRDPQGAVLAVWQPRSRVGAEHVNDVGCLCMNELATSDIDAARSFYEGLFGWTTEMAWRTTAAPSTRASARWRRGSLRTGGPTSRSSRWSGRSSACGSWAASRSPGRSRSSTV
jgi:uncharacterized protein